MEGLTFRQDYFSDPLAFRALSDLLSDVFGIDISAQSRFGGPDPSSMPFGFFDAKGRCVANFSAFTMPMIIGGVEIKFAGYQSGAVRPEYRGRGLYRSLMKSALDWAEETGHAAGILLTDKPTLYTPYGFRSVKQFKTFGPASSVADCAGSGRLLNISNANDVELISRLLDRRTAVSHQFAVTRQKEMFFLNAWFDCHVSLTYLDEREAIVAWKPHGAETLTLLDIVAEEIPTMAEILAAIRSSATRIEAHFPVDKLDWQGTKARYRASCELMVTDHVQELLPRQVMLSPMAEF
jgi:GNAT superfamily N-acetyltransferase